VTAPALDVTVAPVGGAAADAEIDAFLAECPTSVVQQTPAWRDVITSIDRDEPLFLLCRDAAGRLAGVLPAYRFAGPLGAVLTSVPQAGPLGGVACRDGVDREPVYRALLEAYVRLATSTGCALATVISSPFWPDRALYERHLAPEYVLENTCQVLDLEAALGPDGRLRGGSENLRRNLRRAEAGALRIDEEQSAANVEEWYAIHAARHREIGVTPLPRALFTSALRVMVPRDKARFFFVRRADTGAMAGGGFYVHHGQVVDALMPSVRSEDAALAPMYLLALHTMRWARSRGIRHYNWQASPPEGGVHRFKRQWGSRDAPYAYLTRVTGDAEPMRRSTPAALAAGYPWHYVLPFDRVGTAAPAGGGPSTRDAAWAARGGARP
jgi:hypothetical protein